MPKYKLPVDIFFALQVSQTQWKTIIITNVYVNKENQYLGLYY